MDGVYILNIMWSQSLTWNAIKMHSTITKRHTHRGCVRPHIRNHTITSYWLYASAGVYLRCDGGGDLVAIVIGRFSTAIPLINGNQLISPRIKCCGFGATILPCTLFILINRIAYCLQNNSPVIWSMVLPLNGLQSTRQKCSSAVHWPACVSNLEMNLTMRSPRLIDLIGVRASIALFLH